MACNRINFVNLFFVISIYFLLIVISIQFVTRNGRSFNNNVWFQKISIIPLQRGFGVQALPFRNSNLALYFSLKAFAFATHSPWNLYWPSVGEVWMVSTTPQWFYIHQLASITQDWLNVRECGRLYGGIHVTFLWLQWDIWLGRP